MKRKDIKAGTVYAIKKGYAGPVSAVFLEDGAGCWTRRTATSRGAATAGAGRQRATRSSRAAPPVFSPRIDPAAELARFRDGAGPSAEELSFGLEYNLGQVTGPYAEASAAHEKQREAERTAAARKAAEYDALTNRLLEAVTAFGEAGFQARSVPDGFGHRVIGLEAEDAERLLALLREQAEEAAS